jgi:Cu/Ag efflux protein CusF
MLTIRKSFGVIGLALALCTAGCSMAPKTEASKSDSSKGNIKTYALRGEVVSLEPDRKVATLKHEKIEGLMDAMTMGYQVRDPADFAKLKVGETITATVNVAPDDMWVSNVQQDTGAPKQ